ncbi:MAG: radical SAM family heme chaperone HemW [Cytophagales bacterium]|nr:radical SAM family heme chaperone HemW [Cytophagales bacterium]
MAGIYLHIPYCKQACHYCDFHFSTNLSTKAELIDSICKEIALQKDYLAGEKIETIYFGGGTPSLLNEKELNKIFETIHLFHNVDKNAEITLEANPDDLDKNKLQLLKKASINRLSIGIQTFHDDRLKFLNRAHTYQESINCVKNAKEIGFDSLSLDLIYGIHEIDMESFAWDVSQLLALEPEHISAYCLTIEEKTAFGKWEKLGKIKEVSDQLSIKHYQHMKQAFLEKGYEQYEISNFAKDERYSHHNTSYWQQKKYLGIGAGAHSYNGRSRHYNITNNQQYIQKIQKDELPYEEEVLTRQDFINEYLMTSLRTKWGCNLNYLNERFQHNIIKLEEVKIKEFLNKKWIIIKDNTIFLSEEGKLFADYIASELFI